VVKSTILPRPLKDSAAFVVTFMERYRASYELTENFSSLQLLGGVSQFWHKQKNLYEKSEILCGAIPLHQCQVIMHWAYKSKMP
jgi:hypothetical protein